MQINHLKPPINDENLLENESDNNLNETKVHIHIFPFLVETKKVQ